MTLRDWLRARQPAPPARLLARMEEALGPDDVPGEALGVRAMEAAERLLADVVGAPNAGRECALDLLAVDALVTYALEAEATTPARLDARARDAMLRVAALATADAGAHAARG